jgi:methyl-accepting chemotaxis protein
VQTKLDALNEWLVSTQATYTICGAILAVAVIWAVYSRLRLRKARLSVDEAAREVENLGSERAFTKEFETLNRQFAGHPFLGHSWREFADTLILPSEPKGVCRNTEPPDMFFSGEALAGSAINLRLLHAIPNFLTGFGILGTFLGLAAGISQGSDGIAAADLDSTKEALKKLLQGAGLAFMTSIVGLGTSIVLSWADKVSLLRLDNVIYKWNTALDRCLKRATPEQLASDQLTETRKQTLQLDRLNTDIAMSIATAIEARVTDALGPRLAEVVEELRGLRGQQGEFSNDVLGKVSREISGALSGAAGTEMREMATTLNGLVEVLREAAAAMTTGQQQMLQATDGLVAGLQRTFNESANQLSGDTAKAVQSIVEVLGAASRESALQIARAGEESSRHAGAAVDSMKEGIGSLSSAVDRFRDAAERQTQLADQVSGLLGSVRDAHQSMRGTIEPLSLASKSLSAAGSTLSERLSHLDAVATSLADVARRVGESQTQFQAAWNQHEKRFGEIDTSLEKAFRGLNEGVDAFGERVRQFMVDVDQSLGKSVQSLGGVADRLNGTLEELVDVKGRGK